MLGAVMRTADRGVWWLVLGAVAGLGLAAWRLQVHPETQATLSPDTVATVNGVAISRRDFEQALAAIASDRKGGLAPGDAARVLDRLIDEELLLQRAVSLGLVRRESRVRGALVATMIDTVLADDAAREPSAEEVRRFYDDNRDYFAEPGRVRLLDRAVPGTGGAARAGALALAERLRAGAVPAGDPQVLTAPDVLLPPDKLEQYVGPTVVATALQLPVGGVSQPIPAQGAYHIVRVEEREEASARPFEAVEPSVRAELVRRRGEQALRDYLAQLRDGASIATGTGVE